MVLFLQSPPGEDDEPHMKILPVSQYPLFAEAVDQSREFPKVEEAWMIMQLDKNFLLQTGGTVGSIPYSRFTEEFDSLSQQELAECMKVPLKNVITLFNQLVPCHGCRRSAEQMTHYLNAANLKTVSPFVVENGYVKLSAEPSKKYNRDYLYRLFYCQDKKGKMESLIGSYEKLVKKGGKRCGLHSIEVQKYHLSRDAAQCFPAIWDRMDDKCKDEIARMSIKEVKDSLAGYYTRYKMCNECRNRMETSLKILLRETPPPKEGFNPELFEDLIYCVDSQELLLSQEPEFLLGLLEKGLAELGEIYYKEHHIMEKHAKSLDVAQDELVTSLSLCMLDRISTLHLRLQEDELSWEILMTACLMSTRTSYEKAVEGKVGLDRILSMLQDFEREKEAKKKQQEKKQQKKKNKKSKKLDVEVAEVKVDNRKAEVAEVDNDSHIPVYVNPINGKHATLVDGKFKEISTDWYKEALENKENRNLIVTEEDKIEAQRLGLVFDQDDKYFKPRLSSVDKQQIDFMSKITSRAELMETKFSRGYPSDELKKNIKQKKDDRRSASPQPDQPLGEETVAAAGGTASSSKDRDIGYSSDNLNEQSSSSAVSLAACSEGFCNACCESGDTYCDIPSTEAKSGIVPASHSEEVGNCQAGPLAAEGTMPYRSLMEQLEATFDEEDELPFTEEAALEFKSDPVVQSKLEKLRAEIEKRFYRLEDEQRQCIRQTDESCGSLPNSVSINSAPPVQPSKTQTKSKSGKKQKSGGNNSGEKNRRYKGKNRR